MSSDDNEYEDKLDKIFEISSDEELSLLVSIYDKEGYITWEMIENNEQDVDFAPLLWAGMIEDNILQHQGDRKYKLNRRSKMTQYLSGNYDTDSDEDEEEDEINYDELPDLDYSKTKWSRYDKTAALVAAICMVGFSFGPIRQVIYGLMSIFYGPLISTLPLHIVILVLGIITSIWSTYVRERLIETDVSDFKEHLNALKGGDSDGILTDPDEMDDKHKDKMSKIQLNMMKAQIKPFGWIMLGTIPTIIWVFTTATITGDYGFLTLPYIGEFPWAGTVIGPLRTWIFWYIICSVTSTQVIQKLIDW